MDMQIRDWNGTVRLSATLTPGVFWWDVAAPLRVKLHSLLNHRFCGRVGVSQRKRELQEDNIVRAENQQRNYAPHAIVPGGKCRAAAASRHQETSKF